MQREKIRLLIQFSSSVEEADKIVEEQGFVSVREKLAFLRGMFDYTLVGRNDNNVSDEESVSMDYYSFLATIISSRWEELE